MLMLPVFIEELASLEVLCPEFVPDLAVDLFAFLDKLHVLLISLDSRLHRGAHESL